MHLLYCSNNFWKIPWKSSCVSMSMTFVIASFNLLNCFKEKLKVIGEQGLDYREGEELSSCPSWSNSQWQGWSCELVHCSGGNATDPFWRVLASSDGISSWTPLKPQHSNPNPNCLANQLWCIDFLTPSHTSHHPSQTPCLPWISYATQKLMLDSCKMGWKAVWSIPYVSCGIFSKFKTEFYCISFF